MAREIQCPVCHEQIDIDYWHNHHCEPMRVTNADRIRSMTNEELEYEIRWLNDTIHQYRHYGDRFDIEAWLNSEEDCK